MKKLTALFIFFPLLASAATISDELQDAISDRTDIENVYVSLMNKDKNQEYSQVEVQHLDLNKKAKKFKAIVIADGASKTVSGSYEQGNLMPVLKDTLAAGTEITDNHISLITVPASKDVRKYFITAEEMEGKVTKKRIASNQLVAVKDLSSPVLITKGTNVKMLFNKGNLAIEALGQALENGGKDEFIKVKNLTSNKVLSAKVVDESTVSTGG